MAIDTLKFAKRLREAGFSEPQAEAVVATGSGSGRRLRICHQNRFELRHRGIAQRTARR
jgi:hypothetical protein